MPIISIVCRPRPADAEYHTFLRFFFTRFIRYFSWLPSIQYFLFTPFVTPLLRSTPFISLRHASMPFHFRFAADYFSLLLSLSIIFAD